MDKYYLTKERYEELEKELDDLKSRGRQEVAERLKRAKEFGDLSENSEYAEAKEEQAAVESRIFELEEIMKKAVLITKAECPEEVRIGCTVTVKKDGQITRYSIVGSYEANPGEGRISDESPIGRALLHRRVGDSVTVATPSGEVMYQITKIE